MRVYNDYLWCYKNYFVADGASDTDSSTGDDHPSLHNKPVDANCNEKTSEQTNGGWQVSDIVLLFAKCYCDTFLLFATNVN